MTIKAEIRLYVLVGVGILGFAAFVFYIRFAQLDFTPSRVKKYVDYYSIDSNYHQYRGIIKEYEFREYGFLVFDKVTVSDNSEHDAKEVFGTYYLKVFSADPKKTWEDLNPTVGLEVSFICANETLEKSDYPPIVQITANEIEILSFEEGKEALIDYYNSKSYYYNPFWKPN